MIFLSIIIPHYNLPRDMLVRCVESLFAQNMEQGSFEVIVVDDGSEEKPYWLLPMFNCKELRVVEIEHAGLSEARNKGIDVAKGKYIMFLDSDDYLQPDSIGNCIETLHIESPQILRYKYNVCTARNDFKVTDKRIKYTTSNTISGAAYMTAVNLPGCAWSYFINRELLIKHNLRFRKGMYHEDEEFSTIVHYHATSLIDCNAHIYNYCIREGSITTSHSKATIEKRMEDMLTTLARLTEFRKEHEAMSNSIQRRGLDRKITMLTVDTIQNLFYNNKSAREIINICNHRIKKIGLYPLPQADYTLKYKLFRIIANSNAGLRILRLLLPRHTPQKR
ncbi:MAG: glycosyltransferase family 2 protein [Bacteroidaceae bacterium]|nr:glycosyltransferase family 2 protein [Bacteroidaceae bacterium]